MSDEDRELAEETSLRRFKALLKSENPHVQSHIRGFLDAMDFMHGGTRPAEPDTKTAAFRGSSLKSVLSQVAGHITSVQDAGKGSVNAGSGGEGDVAKEDKPHH